jgi:hypothetical protein
MSSGSKFNQVGGRAVRIDVRADKAGWAGAVGVVAALVSGCGDSRPEAAAAPTTAAAAVPAERPVPRRAAPVDDGLSPVQAAIAAAQRPESYLLVLTNDRAVHRDHDELPAVHGRGYAALDAFIYARGKPRAASPVASIKPTCLPAECRYLPPRHASHADSYVISIDDESVAQLTALEDRVVIRPRQLAWNEPAVVQVTLAVPGQPPVVRRIVYGAAPG